MAVATTGRPLDEPDLRQPTRFRKAALRLGWGHLTAVAVLVVSGLAYSWPLAIHPRSLQVGSQDSELVAWFIGAQSQAVMDGRNPLILDYAGVPDSINAMWNTGMTALALPLAPLVTSLGAMTTLSLVYALSPVLNGLAAYWALRLASPVWYARLAGALLFTFSPFFTGQFVGHAHLVLLPLVPVVLYLAVRVFSGDGHALRNGALLGVATAVQSLLLSEEVAAILVVSAASLAVALVALIRPSLAVVRRATAGLAIAAVSGLVLVAYPLAVQFFGPHVLEGPAQALDYFKTDVTSLVVPPPTVRLSPAVSDATAITFRGAYVETTAYLGLAGLLFLAWCWRGLRERSSRAVLLATVTTLLLSFGGTLLVAGKETGILLPLGLVQDLPLVDSLLPARITLCTFAFLAVLVARSLSRPPTTGRSRVVGTVLVAALALTLAPYTAQTVSPTPAPPRFFTDEGSVKSFVAQDEPLLVVPVPGPFSVEAMRWQRASGFHFRTVGGYFLRAKEDGTVRFGGEPRPTATLLEDADQKGTLPGLTAVDRQRFQEDVRFWGTSKIVLGPSANQELLRIALVFLTEQEAQVRDDVLVWDL